MRITPRDVVRFVVLSTFSVLLAHLIGLTLYLFERDYSAEFEYPLDVDVTELVNELRSGVKPTVKPINEFEYEVSIDSSHKCRDGVSSSFEPIRLLFLVKSKANHFLNRRAIRSTWGWEDRFSDVSIRRVFLLGLPRPTDDLEIQTQIDIEQERNLDLVQAAFVDDYFNNTLKAILGLKWVATFCPTAEYVFFVDDDFYVSTKNVLRFLRRPSTYPEHLKRALLSKPNRNVSKRAAEVEDDEDEVPLDVDASGDLYVGFRFFSKPHRLRFLKWFVSLDEYPFDKYPPYVTAGAYVVSRQTSLTFYYASLYTVPFRFDDVYVGILAKKTGVVPKHNDHFHFYKPTYSKADYAFVVAAHGFHDPEELVTVWTEQRELGNA